MPSPVKSNQHTEEYYFEEGCFITELWNSPADDAISIARVRLPAGDETHLHRLQATVERYLILRGEALVWLGDDEPLAVVADDVVIIAENRPQKIRNSGSSDLLFLAICTPRFVMENYRDCAERKEGNS